MIDEGKLDEAKAELQLALNTLVEVDEVIPLPVLRAELLRSVYRNDFTRMGKILGKLNGSRPMTIDVLKEWWYYLFQCSECRRCSLFCPYGIDIAEITMMGREWMNEIGVGIDWICTPAANCQRTGNHLGVPPHAFKDNVEFAIDDLKDILNVAPEPVAS